MLRTTGNALKISYKFKFKLGLIIFLGFLVVNALKMQKQGKRR